MFKPVPKPIIEWNKSSHKRFKETLVFIHAFDGSLQQTRPYQDLVAQWGFDSLTYTQELQKLSYFRPPHPKWLPVFFKGLHHYWADLLTKVLDEVPGNKVIYSFSFPSVGALGAIAEREAKDVKGWVADGGPFLKIHHCISNFFTYHAPMKNPVLREAATLATMALIERGQLKREMSAWFQKLPPHFPILSIRGWQDPLVPMKAIDQVFDLGPHCPPEILSLPQGRHMDALKNHPQEYIPRLQKFLERVCEKTEASK